jgi:RND family efflux transporter MFP subunit
MTDLINNVETSSEAVAPADFSKRGFGRKAVVGALTVAGAMVALTLFGIHTRSQSATVLAYETHQAAIIPVSAVHPSVSSGASEIVIPATVQAFIDTPIYARTSGYLRHWYADIGSHVKQGELLVEIETPELDHQVQQAQSDLATARANYELAQITAKRWKNLMAQDAVSEQETDQATSDLNAKKAVLEAQQANLRRLQQLQSFEKIYAPFDGVITARNTDIGDLIQAGENTRQQELFHLSAIHRMRVFVPVPEVYQSAIASVKEVSISSDAFPHEHFTGKIARSTDAIDPQSRTLRIEVDIDNPKAMLLPGAYVFAHIPLPAGSQALTIPSNALLFREEGLRVGVVRDGRVQLLAVSIGHDYGSKVEITSGLTAQDQVILNPPDSLVTGAQAQVQGQAAGE